MMVHIVNGLRVRQGYHAEVFHFRRELVRRTLARASGNRSKAAAALGLNRTYLLRLLRDLDLKAEVAPGQSGRHV